MRPAAPAPGQPTISFPILLTSTRASTKWMNSTSTRDHWQVVGGLVRACGCLSFSDGRLRCAFRERIEAIRAHEYWPPAHRIIATAGRDERWKGGARRSGAAIPAPVQAVRHPAAIHGAPLLRHLQTSAGGAGEPHRNGACTPRLRVFHSTRSGLRNA